MRDGKLRVLSSSFRAFRTSEDPDGCLFPGQTPVARAMRKTAATAMLDFQSLKTGAGDFMGRFRKSGPWLRERFRRLSWPKKLLVAAAAMVLIPLLLGLTAIGAVFGYYGLQAAKFDMNQLRDMPERTLIFDRNNKPLGYVFGHGENRNVVKLDQVSKDFVKALLAREDNGFYWHGGIDWKAVARAAWVNSQSDEIEQGASTLTMQLARNSFGMQERTFDRKFIEAALAQRIENEFSKDEILELYMNRIYFGSGLYGVERAAQGYFMKPAKDLTLSESALLAGLIRGPSRLNPFRNLQSALDVRDETLNRMVSVGKITRAQADAARNETIALRPEDKRQAASNFVAQAVQRELDLLLDPKVVKKGGLKVHVTIDADLQQRSQEALADGLANVEKLPGYKHPTPATSQNRGDEAFSDYLQGALVVLDNQTGGTLALLGGRDYADTKFNRAWDAKRQAGSTFKSFVFATAFAKGMLPGAYESDGPISLPGGNGHAWTPANSDGQDLGIQPAKVGLVRSRNTMSIRTGLRAGLDSVRETAALAGFGDALPESPVLFLGAFETNPVTLTSAYTVFPNQGIRKRPYLIERIEDHEGKELYRNQVVQYRVLPESAAWMTSEVLGEVITEGTAASARGMGFDAPAGGKTGTTDDYRDAWFVGFTDKVTCGVWVGFDQPKTIVGRGYGSKLALPVWVDVMKFADEHGYAPGPLPAPADLQPVEICRHCSQRASLSTSARYTMMLPTDAIPAGTCPGHGQLVQGERPPKREFRLFSGLRRIFGGR